MIAEYGALLRCEFIPEGIDKGPTKDIYFEFFKKGTCGLVGAVFGWPTLDHPISPGGKGQTWMNMHEGARYSELNVTLPRTDQFNKANYSS